MSAQITLNGDEMTYCLELAVVKFESDRAKGYKDTYFKPETDELKFKYQLLAIASEYAAAKWLNVPDPKPKLNTFKNEPDVFPDWEVKHSLNPEYMTIRPTDRDSDRAVFVTGENPFTIEGWLPVKYCKDDTYAYDGYEKPCWRVPRAELVKVLPHESGA